LSSPDLNRGRVKKEEKERISHEHQFLHLKNHFPGTKKRGPSKALPASYAIKVHQFHQLQHLALKK
jgi:hypothetical protein